MGGLSRGARRCYWAAILRGKASGHGPRIADDELIVIVIGGEWMLGSRDCARDSILSFASSSREKTFADAGGGSGRTRWGIGANAASARDGSVGGGRQRRCDGLSMKRCRKADGRYGSGRSGGRRSCC